MNTRALATVSVACSWFAISTAGIPQTDSGVPEVVRAAIPLPSGVARFVDGDATLHVVSQNGHVLEATVIAGDPLAGTVAKDNLKTWAFADLNAAAFDVTYKFRRVHPEPCRSIEPIVRANLPHEVEIVTGPSACDGGSIVAKPLPPVRQVRGVVSSAPFPSPAIDAAYVSIQPTEGGESRSVRASVEGDFALNGIPSGTYVLTVSAPGSVTASYLITVSPAAPDLPLDLHLEKSLGVDSSPSVVVTAGELPRYPRNAWEASVQGSVAVRVSTDRGRVIDVDGSGSEPSLVAAAVANVRSWNVTFASRPTIDVDFVYHLKDGACQLSPTNTEVSMEFPGRVEVQAPRRCAGLAESALFVGRLGWRLP